MVKQKDEGREKIDPFYQETKDYVRRLQDAGVEAKLLELEGCYHGFDILNPKAKPTKEARKFLFDGFKEAQKKYRVKEKADE